MPGIRSQPRPRTSAADGTSASGTDHGRRLSPLDGSFLRLESPQSHMHVGFSAVFAAPSGRPRPSVEALRERAAGRLHEVPWCRWRLDPAPLGLSEPRWIDDVRFDLAAHIVALTQPDDPVSYASFDARRAGGTLNDVGLAAVAGAVRALLRRDDERPPAEPLKAMVPVSMRRLGDTAAGNQISMVTIALPVHLEPAIDRLDWVREQTMRLKQTDR